jgi:hypothetical protein
MGVLPDRRMLESMQSWQKCSIAQEAEALLSANVKTTVVIKQYLCQ